MRHQGWPPPHAPPLQILGTWQGMGDVYWIGDGRKKNRDQAFGFRPDSPGGQEDILRRKVESRDSLWGDHQHKPWEQVRLPRKTVGRKEEQKMTPGGHEAGDGFMQKKLWRSCQVYLRKNQENVVPWKQEKRIFQEGRSNPLCQMLPNDYYER